MVGGQCEGFVISHKSNTTIQIYTYIYVYVYICMWHMIVKWASPLMDICKYI